MTQSKSDNIKYFYLIVLFLVVSDLVFAKESDLLDSEVTENSNDSMDLEKEFLKDDQDETDLSLDDSETNQVSRSDDQKEPEIPSDLVNIAPKSTKSILDGLVKKNLLQVQKKNSKNISNASTFKSISLEFNGAPLKDVVNSFAKESGINFIIPESIGNQKVYINLKGVPWDEALQAILDTNSLGMNRLKGNVVRIDTLTNLEQEKSTMEKVRKNYSLLIPTKILVARLSYAKSKDIEGIVTSLLPSAEYDKRVKVKSDPRTNSIVVEATPDELDKIKGLIERIDRQTPQVKIESRVVEILKHANKFLGINWGGPLRLDAGRGLGFGNLVFPNNITSAFSVDTGARNNDSGGRLDTHLGSINNSVELDLRLRMSELTNYTKSLQNNSVIVLDHEKASIEAGQEDFFSMPTGPNQNVMSSVRFSLLLEVTPHITADGAIQMEIKVENSSPSEIPKAAQTSKNLRTMTTSLLRQNNETAVIGGIYTSSYIETSQGFPFLSKLPIIGLFFKSKGKSENKRELLILVTPTILNSEKSLGKSQSKISQNEEDLKDFELEKLMKEDDKIHAVTKK